MVVRREIPGGSDHRSARVLVVDDDAQLRSLVGELLELAGFEVVAVAGDYDGALAASVSAPRAELAVVDLRLGGKSGVALTRALTAEGIRVLVYTGGDDRESLRAALQAGAAGLASKMDPVTQLAGALAAVAAGETYVAPRLAELLPRDTGGTLTPREREVLFLLATGLTNEQLAAELGLSAETTRTQIRNAMRKLGAHTRVEAVTLAASRGEITLP